MSDATPFYRLSQWVLRTGFRLLQGIRVEGLENVPRQGPCIIVCNHISWLDPPFMGGGLRHRQVHFMAKTELFDRPVLGEVINALGAFPVDRGQADRRSLRRALDYLSQGRIVCIFPEGTRGDGNDMASWHVGMAMLASHARVDIIPAAVKNTRQLLEERHLKQPKQPMWLRFGAPIQVNSIQSKGRVRLQELQDRSQQAVADLLASME